MLDNAPNFMMVNDAQEPPEEIITDYLEMIKEMKDDNGAIQELLWMMFDDVNYWTVRQLLIDQAKNAMANLEILDEQEHTFIDDDEDFYDE